MPRYQRRPATFASEASQRNGTIGTGVSSDLHVWIHHRVHVSFDI
ncbi:MAG TPA: hypothetical protein VH913_00105 [Hyphomicrobiaceae bacterium]